MINKKFKANELFVAQIVRIKSIKHNGPEILYEYDMIKTGIFKKIGDKKFYHISSGIVFDKLDIYRDLHDFCVSTKEGMYLSLVMSDKQIKKICVKDIIKLENELNKRNKEKTDELKKEF